MLDGRVAADGTVSRHGWLGLDHCAVGYDGLDLSEDYHEDGWAGSKPQYVDPINEERGLYLTSRLSGFTFDGSFVVGGSDEGKEHLFTS